MKLTKLIDVLWDALDIHGDLDVFAEIADDSGITDAQFSTEIVRHGNFLFVRVHADSLDRRLENAGICDGYNIYR